MIVKRQAAPHENKSDNARDSPARHTERTAWESAPAAPKHGSLARFVQWHALELLSPSGSACRHKASSSPIHLEILVAPGYRLITDERYIPKG